MDMSFSEKSAWISFTSTLLIFGYYFFNVLGLSGTDGEAANHAAVMLLAQAIVLTIIVESVFHGMLAATNHKAAELGADERDKTYELKASKIGYAILSTGVIIVIGRMIILELNPDFADHNSSLQIPMLTAHMLMFSFILSELARFGMQILYYRKED